MVSLSVLREPMRFRLENYSHSFLHRIPWFISPALLTCGNFFFSIWAGIAFTLHFFTLAFLFLLFAFFCDTFDGMIARVRHESSYNGYFLDASIDRLGEAIWFIGIFLSTLFPTEAVLVLVISSFLISYFRVQLARIYGTDKPGFMEKGDRNVYFVLLTAALFLGVNIKILILSFWLISCLSVMTVLQLFLRGLIHAKAGGQKQNRMSDPIKLLEEPSDYYLGGT